MIVEVVNTGTELLLGEILNTNFQYLSQQLNRLGFDVLYQTTVGDNNNRLQEVLTTAMKRADIVITTGGLGPTRGDITKEVVAELLGRDCYLDLNTWEKINSFFQKKGLCMSSNNDKQAYIPLGAEILTNDVGTAPGLILEHQNSVIILLPGPPTEVRYMFEHQVLPFFTKKYSTQGIIFSRILKLRNIGESKVAEMIDDIITMQTNPTIAIYARSGEIVIRITAKSINQKEAQTLIYKVETQIKERLNQYIYGIDDTSLAEYLGQKLSTNGNTIAFAESCTGGLASSLMTDVPGSSEYLLGSVVTYSNKAKEMLVHVSRENLDNYGAVSEQVACEMAQGVRQLFGASYGVGITGIAGPGGGNVVKPVGLVYIAVADVEGVICSKYLFEGTRTENKLRSALAAISMVIDKIKEQRNEEYLRNDN